MMKKILITSLAVIALFSCSKEDIPGQDDAREISFGVMDARTRVENASEIREFGVSGVMNLGSEGTEEYDQYISLFDNERIYRASDADNAAFIYDDKRYWINDRTFHFLGVYPYMQNSVEAATLSQYGVDYDGYRVEFEVPQTADKDFMIAHKTQLIAADATSYPTVDLSFSHALCKVNLNVAKNQENKDDRVDVVIVKMKIRGMWKSGTLYTSRFANYTDNWDFYGSSILEMTTPSDFIPIEVDVDGTKIMGDLMLIPQAIGVNAVAVEINYVFYSSDGSTGENKTATAYLPATTWEASKEYTYNIVLAAEDNQIRFTTPTVKPWGAAQTGGTIIIQ